MFVTVATFLIIAGAALADDDNSCEFKLQTDLDPKREPLVLEITMTDIRGDATDEEGTGSTEEESGEEEETDTSEKGKEKGESKEEVETLSIAKPRVVNGTTGVITVKNNHKMMIACTGRNNRIAGNNKDLAYLTCKNGKFFLNDVEKVDEKEATLESTSCTESYARSRMEQTQQTCGSGEDSGIILQLGFKLSDERSWFPVIELCHNTTRGVTLYESHTLEGKSIRGAVKSSDRRPFAKGLRSLYPGINPDSLFRKDGQGKAFRQILGYSKYETYLNSTTYLARGHLAPDADFIFNSEQLMTYYFANAAPQYQEFNAGNWLVVENAARDLAAKVGLAIDVTTGQFGILELTDSTDHKREMYLEPDKKMIPVPRVFWKVLQHPVTKACTVAVGHNNIFHKKAPTPICTPKKPDGWPTFTDISKGYTYYCDYAGFAKTVKFAPNNDCKDLFNFPRI